MAMMSYEHAAAWSRRAATYQVLTGVLAIGLAFAAWASLMSGTGLIRWLFAFVAVLILVAGLCFLGIHLIIREPLPEYLSLLGPPAYSRFPGL